MFRDYKLDIEQAVRVSDFLNELRSAVDADELHVELSRLVPIAESFTNDSMPGPARNRWEIWLAAARYVNSSESLSNALQKELGVADAKAACDLRLEQFRSCLDEECSTSPAQSLARAEEIIKQALPNLYHHLDHSWDDMRQWNEDTVEDEEVDHVDAALPKVICIGVFVDDCPIVTPQEIQPAMTYRLRISSKCSSLSKEIRGIQFEFLSTLSFDQYQISECSRIFGPDEVIAEDSIDSTCSLVFPYEQSDPFRPVVLAATAYLLLPDGRKRIRVIGNDQIQFRVRSHRRTLLSAGQRRMDAHVHDLLQGAITKQPAIKDEIDELVPILDALVAIQSTFAQLAVFKGRSNVSEAEFQRETLRCLRMRGLDPREGTKQAGGITDIRIGDIIIELKVEDTLTSRSEIASKYGGQTTQYQGVDARSISIVLCLDTTEKEHPSGDIRNDVVLQQVATNADASSHASWIFLFVVQANQLSPSEYSR